MEEVDKKLSFSEFKKHMVQAVGELALMAEELDVPFSSDLSTASSDWHTLWLRATGTNQSITAWRQWHAEALENQALHRRDS